MLQSVYILLGVFSFISLAIGLMQDKRSIKIVFLLTATMLFGAGAAGSMEVAVQDCGTAITTTNQTPISYPDANSTITSYSSTLLCSTNTHYDEHSIWLFTGMAMFAGVMSAITMMNMMTMRERN